MLLLFASCPLQLVKLCSGMIEAGKAYVSANKLFVSGIRDLSQQCKKDEMISVSLHGKSGVLSPLLQHSLAATLLFSRDFPLGCG